MTESEFISVRSENNINMNIREEYYKIRNLGVRGINEILRTLHTYGLDYKRPKEDTDDKN